MIKRHTLLEKAKAVMLHGKIPITEDEIELALGWIRGEVSWKQANVAMGKRSDGGNGLYRIAIILRKAYQDGKLKIVIEE